MAGDQIHLGIKLGYSLFLLVLGPVYWAHHGPRNFLWFSDIARLTTGATLWLKSRSCSTCRRTSSSLTCP